MARRRKEDRRAPHHEACDAMRSLLLPCAATGVSLLAVWCLSGATPGGPPWTPAVTLAHGCGGLSARRMAVWWTCREPSQGRHVRRQFLRNAVLDCTPILPAIAYHQRNDVETYRRSMRSPPARTGSPLTGGGDRRRPVPDVARRARWHRLTGHCTRAQARRPGCNAR
jgi:hypothetical protein